MRRSWIGPVLLAIAALLLAGSGTPALASQPSPSFQGIFIADEPPADLDAPQGDIIVVQYGDPDDAITGNRGPNTLGQTSGTAGLPGDVDQSLPHWLQLVEELLGEWMPFLLP